MSVEAARELLRWLVDNGGHVEPSLVVVDDPTIGLGLQTTAPLAADTPLVACPFALAVTPERATAALRDVLGLDEAQLVWARGAWNERMRVAAYLGLHWVAADSGGEWPAALAHRTYLASLPPAHSILTPLHFTEPELALLEGTNLHHAAGERAADWAAESAALRAVTGLAGLTWERYLAAATYLSSRAFPSRLLALAPDPAAESHPVLLPGLDLLNHARGQPVTWLSTLSHPAGAAAPLPVVALSSPQPLGAGAAVHNNYGPKTNDELVLAYGFALAPNPDDAVALRLGAAGIPAPARARLARRGLDAGAAFRIAADGEMDRELLEVVRVMLGEDEDGDEDGAGHSHGHGDDEDEDGHDHAIEAELHLEMDVLDMLADMVRAKAARLAADPPAVDARPQVRHMCDVYRHGQRDILLAAIAKLEDRMARVDALLEEDMGCPGCG